MGRQVFSTVFAVPSHTELAVLLDLDELCFSVTCVAHFVRRNAVADGSNQLPAIRQYMPYGLAVRAWSLKSVIRVSSRVTNL